MKHNILFIVFLSFSSILFGQMYEIGLSVGGTNFIGDIGNTHYLYPKEPAGAFFFKYNANPRIALRATYSYLPVSADDANAATNFKQNRGFNFKNVIQELAAGIEFNFFEYDISSEDKRWTPYLLLEMAAFNYKAIESEQTPGDYVYKNSTAIAVPFGIGFKSKLFGKFAFSVETKFRYTFKDDIDYTTSKIPALDFEGTGNDWYVYTGCSLIYTFGRPACYTKGL